MSYKVEILNRYTLAKIKDIEIVNEPLIVEEIGGSFTLDFDAHYNAKNDLTSNVIISVDGKYFKIAKVIKNRSDTITLSVRCEHISYELIADYDLSEDLELEGTAEYMINQILLGSRFRLVECLATSEAYYRTSSADKRQQLIDVMNLFGGELIFDNFNVSLVYQRGGDKGLDIELGVNLLGVTEEINFVNGNAAYEVDLVDLAHVSGNEIDFSSAELGDTITIIDNILGIHSNERIISISYNPFKRALPTITVGDYIRNLSEYQKEEEEKKDEDEDSELLALFRIGDVNALPVMSDERSAVIEYITDTTLQGIIPSADIEVIANKTGVQAGLKSGINKYLTAMVTTETEDGITASFKPMPSTDLTSLVLPGDNVSVSVVIIITSVPFADLVSGLTPVEGGPEDEDFESPLIGAYGVRVLINDNADGYLTDFKIGDVDVLQIGDTDATTAVIEHIKGNAVQLIAPTVYEVQGKLKGIYAKLKSEYKNYHLTLLYSTKNAQGVWEIEETRKIPFTNARIFTTPRVNDDNVIVAITKEPYYNINRNNVDSKFVKAFGVRIKSEMPEEEPYLSELKIGSVDILTVAGIMIETDTLAAITAEVDYREINEYTGLFVKLTQAYNDYAINVREYTASGSTTSVYANSHKTKKYPNNLVAVTVTVSKGTDKQIFGFKFTETTEPPEYEEKLYLEFGAAALANTMNLSFKNGPYDEIKSITTGLSGGGSLSDNVSIIVDEVRSGGKVTSLQATSTNASESATVNFQVVCMKMEVVANGRR